MTTNATGDLAIRAASAESMLALIAVTGPAGSGKTFGSLLLAHGLAVEPRSNNRGGIVVVDSEARTDRRGVLRGRSETYRGYSGPETGGRPLVFDVLPLSAPYTISRFLEAMQLCWTAGYEVVVVDSLSHEWMGVLAAADAMKSSAKNQYTDVWGKLSPEHERFVERILRAPSHLVCTMRSKMAYEVVDGKPKKIGLQPIQREGVDYNFEIIFDVDEHHRANLVKANANYGRALSEETLRSPVLSVELGKKIAAWLGSPSSAGTPAPANPARPPQAETPASPAATAAAGGSPAQGVPAPAEKPATTPVPVSPTAVAGATPNPTPTSAPSPATAAGPSFAERMGVKPGSSTLAPDPAPPTPPAPEVKLLDGQFLEKATGVIFTDPKLTLSGFVDRLFAWGEVPTPESERMITALQEAKGKIQAPATWAFDKAELVHGKDLVGQTWARVTGRKKRVQVDAIVFRSFVAALPVRVAPAPAAPVEPSPIEAAFAAQGAAEEGF